MITRTAVHSTDLTVEDLHKSLECCRRFFSHPPTFLHYCLLVCNTAYVIKLFILGVVESKRWKENDSTSFSLCRNNTPRNSLIASFCFSVFHLSCLKIFTKKREPWYRFHAKERVAYIDACWLSFAVSFFWLCEEDGKCNRFLMRQ